MKTGSISGMAVKIRLSAQVVLFKQGCLPIKNRGFYVEKKAKSWVPNNRKKERKSSIKGFIKDKHRKQWKVETPAKDDKN